MTPEKLVGCIIEAYIRAFGIESWRRLTPTEAHDYIMEQVKLLDAAMERMK